MGPSQSPGPLASRTDDASGAAPIAVRKRASTQCPRLGSSFMETAPWLTDQGVLRCFYCETPVSAGEDPDSWHPGLKESHRLLWSRPLPDGHTWSFTPARDWYLKNDNPRPSEPAEWSIGSDNFATTHTNALREWAVQIPGYEDGHLHEFCTIGGYLPFPNGLAQKRQTATTPRRYTLNQAKGMDTRVFDRIDSTLACIRLHFSGVNALDANPIGDVLDAYGWFFEPFGTGQAGFDAYVEYFFLDPFVKDGHVTSLVGEAIGPRSARPGPSLPEYLAYIEAQRSAVKERNALIARWWQGANQA